MEENNMQAYIAYGPNFNQTVLIGEPDLILEYILENDHVYEICSISISGDKGNNFVYADLIREESIIVRYEKSIDMLEYMENNEGDYMKIEAIILGGE